MALTIFGLLRSASLMNFGRDSGDIDCLIGKPRKAAPDGKRVNGGKVTLQIDHMLRNFVPGRADARRPQPGRNLTSAQVAVTMASPPAAYDGGCNFAFACCHQDMAELGLNRPAPDMHNHGCAVDVGQWALPGSRVAAMRAGMTMMVF